MSDTRQKFMHCFATISDLHRVAEDGFAAVRLSCALVWSVDCLSCCSQWQQEPKLPPSKEILWFSNFSTLVDGNIYIWCQTVCLLMDTVWNCSHLHQCDISAHNNYCAIVSEVNEPRQNVATKFFLPTTFGLFRWMAIVGVSVNYATWSECKTSLSYFEFWIGVCLGATTAV